MNPATQKYLSRILNEKFQAADSTIHYQQIGGGCINDCFKVSISDSHRFFLKINSAIKFPGLFEKEKHGLELLGAKKLIRVPNPLHCEIFEGEQILLLEWIETGLKTVEFWKSFGEQLAKLHSNTWLDRDGQTIFGLTEDNYMGSLVQQNTVHQSWIEFFIHCRLQPQIKLAQEKNLLGINQIKGFEKFYSRLPQIFHEENSSLLHGDLWSGNYMCDENSQPVLIDPAVYYGHRSVDLGMTILFGGFDKEFYDAYNYYYPFPKNYYEQWNAANLYPLLIHLNLFGMSYLSQIENILARFE